MPDLNIIWFILIAVLIAGYAILDGFDLGVGMLHLFAKKDEDRRVLLNAIGPVWDGNEVWLITGGGALFAAFPHVYATVFSGFYNALMLLLAVLIFRAVSIEFRSKQESPAWRRSWDVAFSISSGVIAVLLGVALGNVILGVPVDAEKEYAGTFLSLLNPYALLIGLTTFSLFAMHGSAFLLLKTEGELFIQIKNWVKITVPLFISFYALSTIATLVFVPRMLNNLWNHPYLFIIALFNIFAVLNIPREIRRGNIFRAFLSSSMSIAALLALFAIGIFPNILYSAINPAYSLNIYNASSSQKTLEVMLTIALIGVPLVLLYTIIIYRVFRGKVKINTTSY